MIVVSGGGWGCLSFSPNYGFIINKLPSSSFCITLVLLKKNKNKLTLYNHLKKIGKGFSEGSSLFSERHRLPVRIVSCANLELHRPFWLSNGSLDDRFASLPSLQMACP